MALNTSRFVESLLLVGDSHSDQTPLKREVPVWPGSSQPRGLMRWRWIDRTVRFDARRVSLIRLMRWRRLELPYQGKHQ